MLVYVIRHGESETNLHRQWTGWLDANLTGKGRDDAKKAGQFLKDVTFDKVFASDLLRAKETAVLALPTYQAESSPLLREVNVGTLAGQPLSCLSEAQKERISRQGYQAFKGETQVEFYQRIDAVKAMLESLNCDNVALFSHAGWLRGMLDRVLGLHLPTERVRCENCTVAVFEYTNENWRLHSWVNL